MSAPSDRAGQVWRVSSFLSFWAWTCVKFAFVFPFGMEEIYLNLSSSPGSGGVGEIWVPRLALPGLGPDSAEGSCLEKQPASREARSQGSEF